MNTPKDSTGGCCPPPPCSQNLLNDDARVEEAVSIMRDALQDSIDVRFLLFQTKERMKKYISANKS
jgi:hypothetical protein